MATSPAEFQRQQAATAQGTLLLVRRQWDRMTSLDDWPAIASRVTLLTAAGQAAAARRAAEWTTSTLAELGAPEPVAQVALSAFSGAASDGRPLGSLLYSSVVHARNTYADPVMQMESGRKWVSMLARTMVADAGRGAAQVAITATPRAGYLRMVNPPCCQDCAILAGKWFRHNAGFDRHPSCDCTHVPAMSPDAAPSGYVSDVPADQIRDLTDGQRKALDDGADLSQVVNAYRRAGKGRAKLYTTTEGTTRRGWASYVQREAARQRGEVAREIATSTGRRGAVANYVVRRTAPRLTPDAIYRVAATREEAVRLLARNGYLTGSLQDVARLANS